MQYSEKQAAEAIRQHPELAMRLAPTKTELEIIKSYSSVTSAKLESLHSSAANASRFMRRLIEKGYFKRVKRGLFERVI